MTTTVKITELANIGANIAINTLVPVVNMAGTPETQKANLQIVGNLILTQAGNNMVRAAQANIALSVANAAQPNITSVGTLTNLASNGTVNFTNASNVSLGAIGNVRITGGTNGYVLSTDGAGNLSWVAGGGAGSYGNSNVAAYLPTYTGNIGKLSFQYANTNGTILGNNGSFLKLFGPDDTIFGCDTGNTAVWSNGKVEIRSGIDGINDKITSFYANGEVEFFNGAILSSGGLYGNSTAVLGNKSGQVQVYAQNAGVGIQTYTGSAYNTWTFDNAGNLVLPGNTFAVKYANGTTVSLGGGVQSQIANGISNVNIATSGGNVTVKAGSAGNWTFGTDAVLSAPNGSQIVPAGNNFNIYTYGLNGAVQFFTDVSGNNHNWAFDGYGYTNLPFSQGYSNTSVITTIGAGNIMLQAGAGPTKDFLFGSDGNFTAPGAINVGNMVIGTVAGDITADANTGVTFNVSGPDGGFAVNYLDEVGNANTSGGELAFSSETGNTTYRISLSDDLGNGFATKIWRFDGTGNLVLAGGNSVIQSIANSSLDPTNPNVSTMTLTPDANYNGQALVLDPTAPGHIHLRSPAYGSNIDEPLANLFLGGEQTAFEVTQGANSVARIHSGNLTWTFSNSSGASVIDLPGESYIRSNQDTVNIQSVDANNIGRGIYIGTNGTLYFWDGNSQSVSIQQDNTNANITAIGNARITSNVYTWTFGTTGTMTMPGNINFPNNSSIQEISGFIAVKGNNGGGIQWEDGITDSYSVGANSSGSYMFATNGTIDSSLTLSPGATVIANANLSVSENININYGGSNLGYIFFHDAIGGDQAIFAVGGNLSTWAGTHSLNFLTDLAGSGNIGFHVATTERGRFTTTGLTITGDLTVNSGNISGNTNGFAIGYLNIPQVAASNTTLALGDAGKHYYSTLAGNYTVTIPNNATTSFATGTAINLVVQAAGNILVNAASGVTLYMAGSSSAGNRIVGSYGMASLLKVATDTWFINGTGVY